LAGATAAQVVPHIHFHIIPRPPLSGGGSSSERSRLMFGRHMRQDLDDDEGAAQATDLRMAVRDELERMANMSLL
jgi:diadenosine tetraphosphate (Ap4A) HIT family hydrolase